MRRFSALFLTFLILATSALAQDETCLRLIENSISNVLLECSDLEMETLCYGNTQIIFTSIGIAPEFTGDRVPLSTIESLESSTPDSEDGLWGISTASLLDETRNLTVSMVIFGEVSLTNQGESTPFIPLTVSSSTGANIRAEPDPKASLKATLISRQTLYATGRLADDSWLRVELNQAAVGWVSRELVTLADEDNSLRQLPTIPPDESPETLYRPMRSMALTTGVENINCNQAPISGILIQTSPEADSKITVQINQHVLTLHGTAFVQAPVAGTLVLSLIEEDSTALVMDDEDEYELASGERLILTDESAGITSYSYTQMEILPLELLPRPVVIPTNWIDYLIPAQENPLAELTAESTCTIAAGEDVNIRTGPGRAYPVRGSLLANQSAQPQGRAIGTDSGVWWRIAPGAWLRFDVVFLAGRCDDVPYIDLLPRPPRAD